MRVITPRRSPFSPGPLCSARLLESERLAPRTAILRRRLCTRPAILPQSRIAMGFLLSRRPDRVEEFELFGFGLNRKA